MLCGGDPLRQHVLSLQVKQGGPSMLAKVQDIVQILHELRPEISMF